MNDPTLLQSLGLAAGIIIVLAGVIMGMTFAFNKEIEKEFPEPRRAGSLEIKAQMPARGSMDIDVHEEQEKHTHQDKSPTKKITEKPVAARTRRARER